MENPLSKLFHIETQAHDETSTVLKANKKQSGETYQQWGSRWASITVASNHALQPALQVVILQHKTDQAKNLSVQEENKNAIRSKIAKCEGDKNIAQNKQEALLEQKRELENKIETLKNEKIDVQASNKKSNIAKINYYLGLSIIILLALYLFIFYSSASFAAFFSNEGIDELDQAIFYPHAYSDAWNSGIGQFLFILLMPMIFLALGYLIHQFNINRSGITGYIKIATLYVMTFIFDALLAYEISEKVYNEMQLNILNNTTVPYSYELAFSSPSFWIIIFAGFIAYVIWGLVFDFTMESYAEMTSNATSLKKLQQQIDIHVKKLEPLQTQILEAENAIAAIDSEEQMLKQKLSTTTVFDIALIKQALFEFFNGWCAYMAFAGSDEKTKAEASSIFNDTINKLESK